MKLIKNRAFITANELEQISRCYLSINFLDRILANKICPRCSALSDTGRFLLQKHFKKTNLPQRKTIENKFRDAAERYNIHKVKAEDLVALNDLNEWVKGAADKISLANFNIDLHFGLFTVTDTIDIIDDMGTFTIIKINCAQDHHDEKLMNYQIFMNSLWIRQNYNVENNNVMFITPTHEGVKKERFPINLPTHILQDSITHILSKFESKLQGYQQDTDKLIEMPARFGHYCHFCKACFPEDKQS